MKYVTVSAKIEEELRKKLAELGIKPSEVIRESLKKEVEERMRQRLYQKMEKASELILRIGKDGWVKAVRESREER
ncbi:MAG: CopG family transcriptional regulator [Candidatus Bathyarchaeia archaeon]